MDNELLKWSIRHCVNNDAADYNTNNVAPEDLIDRLAQWHLEHVAHAINFSSSVVKALDDKDQIIKQKQAEILEKEKRLIGVSHPGKKLTWQQRLRGVL